MLTCVSDLQDVIYIDSWATGSFAVMTRVRVNGCWADYHASISCAASPNESTSLRAYGGMRVTK